MPEYNRIFCPLKRKVEGDLKFVADLMKDPSSPKRKMSKPYEP